MFELSSEETYLDGQIIFEEGSHGDWIYIVDSGAVELSKNVRGEQVPVDTVKPGDIFGEMAFISGMPRTARARAVGETHVGIFDRNQMDREFNKLSEGFQTIIKSLVVRLKRASALAVERKSRRKDVRVHKVLNLSFKTREGLIKACSADLNGGGIFINTSKGLPKGERFFLNLQWAGMEPPMKIGCEVVWNRTGSADPVKMPDGMGVKFIQLSKEDHRRLVDTLNG
ncbi:MAG: cyclic nucleotide-binding domain-containing protein [Desulfobacterales bacterium]|nr:cyclic nucleotide-binding domain-containing protein [Desulfobacterales bacterium]